MSETSKDATATPLSRARWFIVILLVVVIVLGLGYMGGYFLLPAMIKSAYQNNNCETVLSRHKLYSSAYPAVIGDKDIAGRVRECAVYTLGMTNEKNEAWRNAYNDFLVYSETYPNGPFAGEAHEHSAVVLTNWGREAIDQKQYSEANANINSVLENYADTASAPDAEKLKSDLYVAWGGDLRDQGDFQGAGQIFGEFQTWAESGQKTELIKSARNELAQTYLAWGLALQAQKKFEEAKSKLDMAISADPDPLSSSGVAAEAKENQAKLYSQWGDYLVEQKDFDGAIAQYKNAATLSDATGNEQDAIANVYVKWAESLSTDEDFLGALKQADSAQENAISDSMKKSVDDLRSEIYLAFSKSNGEQAQQTMQDASEAICRVEKKPDLPIFGLDKENIHFGIQGVKAKLPENVAAGTPGGMHYVACIEDVEKVIQAVDFYGFQMLRIRISWNVKLYEVASGKLIETYQIDGADPVALPTEPGAIVAGGKSQTYIGDPPAISALVDWLLTAIN